MIFTCHVDSTKNSHLLGVGPEGFCQRVNKSSKVFGQSPGKARLLVNNQEKWAQLLPSPSSLFQIHSHSKEPHGTFQFEHFNYKFTKHHGSLYMFGMKNNLIKYEAMLTYIFSSFCISLPFDDSNQKLFFI